MLSYSVGISAGNSNQTWAPFHSSVPACASPLDFTSGHRGLTNKAVISYLDDKFRGGGGGGGRTGKKGNRSVGGQESVRLSRLESRVGLASLTNLPASAPTPPQIYQPRAAADARKQKSTWEAPR